MESGYRAYKITDAAGVLIYRAVVADGAGAVKKPGAANAVSFAGITQEAQATQNKSVSVKKSGLSFATAAGVIAVGDAVNVADNTGKIQSCQTGYIAGPGTAATLNVIGFAETAAGADGDVIEVFIQPFCVKTAVS